MPLLSLVAEASLPTSTTVQEAVETIVNLVPTVLGIISSNAVLMVFFCAGILGCAIGVIKRLKR